VQHHVNTLSRNDAVHRVKVKGESNGSPGNVELTIQFSKSPTDEAARDLINSLPALQVLSWSYRPDRGTVQVPKGEEPTWIEILRNEDLIRYANPNHLLYIEGT
jgi:hypothetical protein